MSSSNIFWSLKLNACARIWDLLRPMHNDALCIPSLVSFISPGNLSGPGSFCTPIDYDRLVLIDRSVGFCLIVLAFPWALCNHWVPSTIGSVCSGVALKAYNSHLPVSLHLLLCINTSPLHQWSWMLWLSLSWLFQYHIILSCHDAVVCRLWLGALFCNSGKDPLWTACIQVPRDPDADVCSTPFQPALNCRWSSGAVVHAFILSCSHSFQILWATINKLSL